MGWRIVRAAAQTAAFLAGTAAGLFYETNLDHGAAYGSAKTDDAAVVAAIASRSGPTGGALPGLDAIVARLDPTGHRAWSRVCRGGGALSDPAVAVSPSGNVALAITFQGSIDCGTGPIFAAGGPDDFDALAVLLSPSGNVLWLRKIGDRGPQALAQVAFDPWDSVVLVGSFAEAIDFGGAALVAESDLDIVAVKLDPNGALVWQRRFGERGRNFGVDIAALPSGNTLVLARGGTDIDFGTGVLSAGAVTSFVAALDRHGKTIWSRALWSKSDVIATRLWPLERDTSAVVGRISAAPAPGARSQGAGHIFFARLSAAGDPL